jgi:crotonobetainyl-CoA:carnitine CoA-transferase CaiB-like acyl-CoA transferase
LEPSLAWLQSENGRSASISSRRLFEDVRVISFPTGVVGPALAGLLAEHGAEVIAIEAGRAPRSPQRGQKFQIASDLESNRDRKRIAVDMKHSEGVQLVKNSSPNQTSWWKTSVPE